MFGWIPLLCGQSFKNDPSTPVNLTQDKEAFAQKLQQGELIKPDGFLDEAVWQRALLVTEFIQNMPVERQIGTYKTQVAFFFDDEALYVGARMYRPADKPIQTVATRRDRAGNAERLIISLDTYTDKRTSFSFAITASGVRLDYFHPQDHQYIRDFSYDPVWEANARIDSLGWTAEMRIPFSQLRFNDESDAPWGLNINHYMPQYNEDNYWVYMPLNSAGWSSRFGKLRGLEKVRQPLRIELLPYIAGDGKISGDVNPANPFTDRYTQNQRFGADLKVGIGANLTIDATINPDFGQVEADPAFVNLSAFEVFQVERRPFFSEGAANLRGRANYFYSRRIGQAPTLRPATTYAEQLQNSTILGAAKITGRFDNGMSLGVLTALTRSETVRTFDEPSASFGSAAVEPQNLFGVARIQQEFGKDASTVGLILTGVHRNHNGNPLLSSALSQQAFTGGLDWNLRKDKGNYELNGDIGFSYVEGSRDYMLRLQQSSARFFQRPDARTARVDSNATHLAGYRASLQLQKNGGRHWLWSLGGSVDSPGFEINDMGAMNRSDLIMPNARLTFRENVPSSWYFRYDVNLDVNTEYNFDGDRGSLYTGISGSISWKNFWRNSFTIGQWTDGFDPRLTRGGPVMRIPGGWSWSATMGTNSQLKRYAQLNLTYYENDLGASGITSSIEFSGIVTDQLEISLTPRFNHFTDAQQYVTKIASPLAATNGTRYVFSRVDREELSLQFRVNFSLNPDLTFELYTEPFIATGFFSNLGELAQARTYELRQYDQAPFQMVRDAQGRYLISEGNEEFSIPNLDFRVFSFRSNAVVRWEFIPGSTLFLVWQQNRFIRDPFGESVRPDQLWRTLNALGDNIFAVKFSYWIPAGKYLRK